MDRKKEIDRKINRKKKIDRKITVANFLNHSLSRFSILLSILSLSLLSLFFSLSFSPSISFNFQLLFLKFLFNVSSYNSFINLAYFRFLSLSLSLFLSLSIYLSFFLSLFDIQESRFQNFVRFMQGREDIAIKEKFWPPKNNGSRVEFKDASFFVFSHIRKMGYFRLG